MAVEVDPGVDAAIAQQGIRNEKGIDLDRAVIGVADVPAISTASTTGGQRGDSEGAQQHGSGGFSIEPVVRHVVPSFSVDGLWLGFHAASW